MIRILLLENLEKSRPAGSVKALQPLIVKKIVHVSGDIEPPAGLARIGVVDDDPGGTSAADKEALVGLIQGHREIFTCP
jgi:hypothetical protein